ncbi:hypothetical protein ABMA70_12455 [Halobacteriovorax sp. XZX-3]|uniref:hypothetical protein n=1 Tax=unclassified Halobacteriovorax TaxID=2639665 RepID=UPI003711CA1F
MNLKKLSRGLLYFTFFYNLFGTISFAFPAAFNNASGLPFPPHAVYAAFGAGNIFIWSFVYLFLARQREFNRPLLLVGTIGKFNLFVALVFGWYAKEVGGSTLALGLVDVAMGVVWISYLLNSKNQKKEMI